MIRIGLSLLVLLALAACGSGRETPASVAEAPTRTPVPTYTPTPLPPPEPTADLSETLAKEAAAPLPMIELPAGAPEAVEIAAAAAEIASEDAMLETAGAATNNDPVLTVAQDAVNVRAGPGTDYAVTGLVLRGATFPITGRNEAGDWWQVCCIDGRIGWLYGPLVTTANTAAIAVATDIPAAPIAADPAPVAEQPAAQTPAATSAEPAPVEEAPAMAEVISPPQDSGGTLGNFDPNAQYQIVHYRVLGFDDNNGGIFSKGGQQLIFLTVLDQNGAPVDGATIKDAVGDKLNVVTGSKGPGKAEIKMDWDPYKLYVASDPSGPVTSQISNQMNNPHPHLPDVIGMLGPLDNEYSVCPTPEVRCSPPFFSVHFSYEITFQRMK
ncbi:MAG: SH3 domain-containing protein [Caldilinea sp.]